MRIVNICQNNSIRIGDPNVKTDDGETPLHIACYYGRPKIVQLLMVYIRHFALMNLKVSYIF